MNGGSEWEFGVLGPLRVTHDGAEVRIGGQRPPLALALLLANPGRPVSTERLIDALWGERPPSTAGSALHVHLSKLRATLGDLVVTGPTGYVLAAGRYRTDLDHFESLVSDARRDPSRAPRLLKEALALWRGEPLGDLELTGTLSQWRGELSERRVTAAIEYFDAELAAGGAAELAPAISAECQANPYQERLVGQLMLALYRAGRQAECLDVYARTRTLFATELGLEPGPYLIDLQARVLRQDPDLLLVPAPPATPDSAGEPAASRATASGRRRSRMSLPAAPTRLIGRENDLLELAALCADGNCRLVTITGPGGVGKTRLALAHAQSWGAQLSDGAIFSGLAAVAAVEQVAAEIAADVARHDGVAPPSGTALGAHLAAKETLLVLDNFEQVIEAGTVVSDLLRAAPGLRVLITSRVPLRLRGERVYDLEPLSLPSAGDDPASSGAVELFVECAQAASRHFTPDPPTLGQVAEICSALDGLPLAIELAAAASRLRGVSDIAARLAEPLALGEGELRDLPGRHASLDAAIRWSYSLLTPAAQQTLRSASVFQSAFTPEALAAVMGRECTAELDELIDASLVRPSAEPGRLRLLMLIRAFGVSELEACGELDAVTTAHRRYFRDRHAWVSAEHAIRDIAASTRAVGPDLPDMRAALESAIAARDAQDVSDLAMAQRPLWLARMLPEATTWFDRIATAVQLDPDVEMRLLSAATYTYGLADDTWGERLAARAGELDNQIARILALSNLVTAAIERRDLGLVSARAATLEAALARLPADSSLIGVASTCLADATYVAGDYAQSEAHGRTALANSERDSLPQQSCIAWNQIIRASSVQLGFIANADLRVYIRALEGNPLPDAVLAATWMVARYAAPVDASTALNLLALAERIAAEFELAMWPESELRDEALAVLGFVSVDPAPPEAIADLTLVPGRLLAWLEQRDAAETTPRWRIAAAPDVSS